MNSSAVRQGVLTGSGSEPAPAFALQLEPPVLGALPQPTVRDMAAAGEEVVECLRVLSLGGINLVSEVLRGQGTFYEYTHYPQDDVYDADSRSQYYYHAHRAGEHGHFHTFVRVGPASNQEPVAEGAAGTSEPVHLIAIAMDDYGQPVGLFATNCWVCGGAWLPAEQVIELLSRFRIDHANPSWPVNRWIGAMLRLYRPHIEALLRHRDRVIAAWAHTHPATDALEDCGLEITGYLRISIDETLNQVRALSGAPERWVMQ